MNKAIGVTVEPLSCSRGMKIISFLMILFGLAEIVTGFTHRFFILSTSSTWLATYAGMIIGFFYFMSGLLILTGRKKWAILAIGLLIADVVGRLAMVATGLYPIGTNLQIVGMVIGTSIVVFFVIYVGMKLKYFK